MLRQFAGVLFFLEHQIEVLIGLNIFLAGNLREFAFVFKHIQKHKMSPFAEL
jgi:hypothetical protein